MRTRSVALKPGKYHDRQSGESLTSVGALHDSAIRQARDYMRKARAAYGGGRQIKGFAGTKVSQCFLVDEVFGVDDSPQEWVPLGPPYDKRKVAELKAVLKHRALKVSGVKKDLVQRLKDDDNK